MFKGIVIAFDEHVGLGIIESDGKQIPFHCVNIANGTRTIEVGIEVTFEEYWHPRGRQEAKSVTHF